VVRAVGRWANTRQRAGKSREGSVRSRLADYDTKTCRLRRQERGETMMAKLTTRARTIRLPVNGIARLIISRSGAQHAVLPGQRGQLG
jgi:hypothetical protein